MTKKTTGVPVAKATVAMAVGVAEKLCDMLCGLQARWQDEHEYEDWSEYDAAIRKAVEAMETTHDAVYIESYPGLKNAITCRYRVHNVTFRIVTDGEEYAVEQD